MDPDEVLTGQSGLEGIWWALQGRSVRRKLRATVASLLDSPLQLGALRLRRSKYKPGSRLTAYYDISLPATNQHRSTNRSIEVDWRPDGAHRTSSGSPDPLAEQQDEILKDAVRYGIASPFHRLAADMPDWGIRIQVYPLDALFPQLVRLSNPHYVKDSLEKAGLVNPVGDGGKLSSDVSITPIRYRPGERHVLRFDWRGAPGSLTPAATFFAKLYNVAGDAARRMRIADQVALWLEGSGSAVKGARPAALLANDETLVYPMVPGIPLSRALRRPGRSAALGLSLAGSTMHALHNSPGSLAAELPVKTLESEIKVILRAAQHVNVLLPDIGENIKRILGRAQEVHQRMPAEATTFTHSDFKADHLRIFGKSLTLIDFDTCSQADPASDVGKFLADLRFWSTLYRRADIEPIQRQFLSAYGFQGTDARLLRGYLYEVLILIKITLRRVPLADRNWATRTKELIDLSDQLLSTLMTNLGY